MHCCETKYGKLTRTRESLRTIALICGTLYTSFSSSAESIEQSGEQEFRTDGALSAIVDASGPKYVELRSELIQHRPDGLRNDLEAVATSGGTSAARMVARILLRWLDAGSECEAYHAAFDTWIRSSYGTVSGSPSERAISGSCLRDAAEHYGHEVLMLERLFKYEDAPHVKIGVIDALGKAGALESLEALVGLMAKTSDSGIQGACVTAVGRLSGKFHDTRAVKDLVSLYRSVPKSRGTGAPEEILQRMPPGFQANVILALSKMRGPEALAALDQLRATETDPVLLERLSNARRDVQERLERNRADKDTDENPGG